MGYLTEGHLENDQVLTQQPYAPATVQRINFIVKINKLEGRKVNLAVSTL